MSVFYTELQELKQIFDIQEERTHSYSDKVFGFGTLDGRFRNFDLQIQELQDSMKVGMTNAMTIFWRSG